MLQPIKCMFCNKIFIPKHFNQRKFCSYNCRVKHWNKIKKKNHWKPINSSSKICEYCHKIFKPIRKSQKYCSIRCSTKVNPPPHFNTGIYKTSFWTNKEWIQNNYVNQKISISKVAKQYGISREMFRRWLKRLNIRSLSKSIVQSGTKNPYWGKKHSPQIRQKMHKAHPTQQANRNHGWKGGELPYYGPNWHFQREKTRNRDNNTCQDCKTYQIKPKLIVHHIISFRKFGLKNYKKANNLKNLITLCIPCHTKRHLLLNRSFNP